MNLPKQRHKALCHQGSQVLVLHTLSVLTLSLNSHFPKQNNYIYSGLIPSSQSYPSQAMPATTIKLHRASFHFLIQIYGILLYTYTNIYLSSCLLMDIQVISNHLLLKTCCINSSYIYFILHLSKYIHHVNFQKDQRVYVFFFLF